MQIVIDIPEVYYEALRKTDEIISGQRSGKTLMSVIYDAVGKGTPLPKGHGNLFDENDFEKRVAIMTESMDLGYGEIMDIIDEISTIIEADK